MPLNFTESGEFIVNTFTNKDQKNSSIASLSDGSYIIIWDSKGQDGDLNGLYGQRFNADGTFNGTECLINSNTSNIQESGSITALVGGGFIITWSSYNQGGDEYGIYGQLYNSDGTKNGNEFQINTYINHKQSDSVVTGLSNGDFVVIWQSWDSDGSGTGIYGQRVNSDGTKNGGEFQINTYTTSHQAKPAVEALNDGSFIVSWHSFGQDGSDYGIVAKKFDVTISNDIPLLNAPLQDITINEGSLLNHRIPAGTFHDPNADILTLTATLADGSPLPQWLNFDSSTGIFSGKAAADAGSFEIKVTASEEHGNDTNSISTTN